MDAGELIKKYGRKWVWLYLNDQVKVKHAVDIERDGSIQFRSAHCGAGPVWFDGIGWRGLRTPEEARKSNELRECRRCVARLDSTASDVRRPTEGGKALPEQPGGDRSPAAGTRH